MGYQIDFLPVGEASKSGDAIAMRFGDLHGERTDQTVIVIDGGYKATGAKLVEHIKKYYHTDVVDLVINTHPDADHIGGLETVLNELEVKALWIHQPWHHNDGLASKFKDGRITDNSIGERLKTQLNKAYDLVQLAEDKGIPVTEPFTGLKDRSGCLQVLGPTEAYYDDLIPLFDGMPETAANDEEARTEGFFESLLSSVVKIFASWGDDKIADDSKTSAKNSSSVICQLTVDDRRLLFTADAGIEALVRAADELDWLDASEDLVLIQVPHHGSRRNIGPKVLNRLVGEPVAEGESSGISAIVSASPEGEPKHPHKAVTNAFKHRGCSVGVTRGLTICHSHDAPEREGWRPITPEPYHYDWHEEEAA